MQLWLRQLEVSLGHWKLRLGTLEETIWQKYHSHSEKFCSDDKDVNDIEYFITILRVDDNHEWPFMTLFYSFLAWMSYYVIMVWVWLSLERGFILGIFGESPYQT